MIHLTVTLVNMKIYAHLTLPPQGTCVCPLIVSSSRKKLLYPCLPVLVRLRHSQPKARCLRFLGEKYRLERLQHKELEEFVDAMCLGLMHFQVIFFPYLVRSLEKFVSILRSNQNAEDTVCHGSSGQAGLRQTPDPPGNVTTSWQIGSPPAAGALISNFLGGF